MRFRQVTTIAFSMLAPALAFAGSVTGTITFEGAPPVMKPIDMSVVPECHALHKDKPLVAEDLVLGPGQTMGNVLVFVSKGLPDKQWPMPDKPAELTQKGCVYAPHVLAMRAGQPLHILNPDDMMHNVNGLALKNKPFNQGMGKGVKEIEVMLSESETPFMIKCDVHPWMRAYCAVMSHPFYAVTAADGKFTIDGLEAGAYEITAWHERAGTRTANVTVADAAVTQDFKFARPAKK
jgi:hypothetical protein